MTLYTLFWWFFIDEDVKSLFVCLPGVSAGFWNILSGVYNIGISLCLMCLKVELKSKKKKLGACRCFIGAETWNVSFAINQTYLPAPSTVKCTLSCACGMTELLRMCESEVIPHQTFKMAKEKSRREYFWSLVPF